MLVETLGHTRMLKWGIVGVAHWFVFLGFIVLSLLVVEAYGEVIDPSFELPILGPWAPWNLLVEILAVTTVLGIAVLIVIRQINHPRRAAIRSRFAGSHFGQAYFVEIVVLIEGLGVLLVRGLKVSAGYLRQPDWAAPVANWLGRILPSSDPWIQSVATVKVFSAMVWLIVIATNLTMGVAWHRFTVWFNIFHKREDDGSTALGALKPMMSGGAPLNLEEADPETDVFGAGKVEDFSWKGWLDFTTCTECGRCQSQCPAWNTAKPLSPKLVILSLRDHAYAKAPYLAAGGGKGMDGSEKLADDVLATLTAKHPAAVAEAERPLIGTAEQGGVIDPEVLWDCTTCGACVEQCPVDIEHVDHIVDMRRYQVMIESEFPSELGGLFRNLENKGNPWGQNASERLAWTKDLPFEVPIVSGELDPDHEYLFWVGCAGAFDDRARRTVRAVAELLHTAAVGFGVLGTAETCTGDPARRAGNEFLFQMLASANVETINAAFGDRPRRKIVTTCAHCFNTLANEYPAPRWEVRGRAPHPAAEPTGPGEAAGAGGGPGPHREAGHLSRPLLSGPAQQGLLAAARPDRIRRSHPHRDASQLRPRAVLRRRRRADVDGGADRQADQPGAGRRGPGHRRGADRDRLPVLPRDALRRTHRPAGRRRQAGRRGP